MRPTKAIILAAGRGSRLDPLTSDRPKCLLEINGEALVDHQLKHLARAGVKHVVFVVGYQKEKLVETLPERHPNLKLTFIENPDYAKTNAAYSLYLAREHLDEPVIYLNSDVYFDTYILKQVIKHRKPALTAIRKTPWQEEQVNVVVDGRGQIMEIGKHVTADDSHGEFVGITKFGGPFNKKLKRALEQFVESGEHNRFAADAINLAISKKGKKYILDVSHLNALEIDTPEELEIARKMDREGKVTRYNEKRTSFKDFLYKLKKRLSRYFS